MSVRGSKFAIDAPMRRKAARLVPLLLEWFTRNARDLPWRRTQDPYAIWVSEIMLQQTQVTTVIPYYERWMHSLPDLRSLARASSRRLHKLWEGLGYYARVRNMQRTAKIICEQHDGRFPNQFEHVLALPGIGRYTAGAICSIAFNQPTPVLDGNTIRVLTRLFGIASNPKQPETNAALWELAQALVTRAARHDPQSSIPDRQSATPCCSALNQSLMELGARICLPRNPACSDCPIHRHCLARLKGVTDQIPCRTSRARLVQRDLTIVVVQRRGRVWVIQRPKGDLNEGLWEFPRLEEIDSVRYGNSPGCKRYSTRPSNRESLGTFKQSITRYKITARVFLQRSALDKLRLEKPGRWFTMAALQRIPLSSMHRRIADQLLAS